MRRAHRSWLPIAVAALSVLALLPTLATPTDAATGNWTSKCSTRVRLSPYLSAKTVRILPAGSIVRAAGTKLAGYYEADCPSFVRGSSWLKVIAINGKTTQSLYNRTYVWVATKLFKSGPNPTATPKPTATAPTTTNYMSNCETRLRSSTTTDSDTHAIIEQILAERGVPLTVEEVLEAVRRPGDAVHVERAVERLTRLVLRVDRVRIPICVGSVHRPPHDRPTGAENLDDVELA